MSAKLVTRSNSCDKMIREATDIFKKAFCSKNLKPLLSFFEHFQFQYNDRCYFRFSERHEQANGLELRNPIKASVALSIDLMGAI